MFSLHKRCFSSICPLKPKLGDTTLYAVLDIETFDAGGGVQVPYAIGVKNFAWHQFYYLADFLKDGGSDRDSLDLAAAKLIVAGLDSVCKTAELNRARYVNRGCRSKSNIVICYSHNLGGFDGYIIFKALALLNIYDVGLMIDDNNHFIEIRYNNVIFRDSLRIFPASLARLGVICSSRYGKLSLNHEGVTLDLILNNKEFRASVLNYLEYDVFTLWDVIKKFKGDILRDLNVSLRNVYSTSNLAFLTYRTKFLKEPIRCTTKSEYIFLKEAYYGGCVQIYAREGKNLFYYDVNSLYPCAMLKPMPVKYLQVLEVDFNSFIRMDLFGFVDCEVTIDDSECYPQVPYRDGSNLIYPVGTIKGRYFSEEVKSWVKLGYKIKVFKVHVYSKSEGLFEDYVNHFYRLKADDSLKDSRFLNKLMLNGLYGYFGRNPFYSKWAVADSNDPSTLGPNVKSRMVVAGSYCLVKYDELPIEEDFVDQVRKADSSRIPLVNTAISTAVTSWGRVLMQDLKIRPDNRLLYSDTDSVILEKPLPPELVGTELGQVKLEFVVEEAVFVKPKLYGLKCVDGSIILKTAGYPENTLTYEDLYSAVKKPGFHKSFSTPIFFKLLPTSEVIIHNKSLSINGGVALPRYKIVEGGVATIGYVE